MPRLRLFTLRSRSRVTLRTSRRSHRH